MLGRFENLGSIYAIAFIIPVDVVIHQPWTFVKRVKGRYH